MKLNFFSVLPSFLILILLIILQYLLMNISPAENLSEIQLNNFNKIHSIIVICCNIIFIFGAVTSFSLIFWGNSVLYKTEWLPISDFEIREYENMTIAVHKNRAYDVGFYKDTIKNIKRVKVIHYHNIRKEYKFMRIDWIKSISSRQSFTCEEKVE